MNWNKICQASAMGPAAGLIEYNRQREHQSTRRSLENDLIRLQNGESLAIGNSHKAVKTPAGFNLLNFRGEIIRQFTHWQYLIDYVDSYNLI